MSNNQSVGISIKNVGLSFGETEVLKGVNLEIAPGEFFAFLGPSGSGKSTLLRAIAGFGPVPSGEILIGDQDVTHLQPWQRNVGMVFQNYALWPHMTVQENVAFGLEERKVAKSDIVKKVRQALELVGLADLSNRRPSELSGGQQQRIALARTIVVEPKVLLLDEPLSNLDANLRVQMRRDILKLQQQLGITTIFVTHDQEEANTTADRMAVLSNGVIQQVGAPMSLYDAPVNRFVANFIGSANIIDGSITLNAAGKLSKFVSTEGLTLDLSTQHSGSVSLIFRPQNTLLLTEGATIDNGFNMSGQIVFREFLGSQIRYGIDVQGHLLSVDEIHSIGALHRNVNDLVRLGVTYEQAVVVNI